MAALSTSYTTSAKSEIPKDLPAYASERVKSSLAKFNTRSVHVDENCSENALRWVFQNTMQPLYRKVDFSKEKITIVVTGRVESDCMQDYLNMAAVANELKKVFSNAKIVIGAEVKYLCGRKDQFVAPPGIETHIWGIDMHGRFENKEGSYENGNYGTAESNKCDEIARSADLVFDVSNANQSSSLGYGKSINYARILEYGVNAERPLEKFDRLYSESQRDARNNAMGVAPFECGLLWSNLSNEKIGLEYLSDKKLAEFLTTNKDSNVFHFADIQKKADEFIATCIQFNKSSDRRVIDVVIRSVEDMYNSPDKLVKWLKERGHLSDIRKIQFFKKDGNKNICLESEKKIQDNDGKLLRVIDPFPLTPEDVHQLMALSSGFAGSSEDACLSDTLSMKQVPYYEMLPHKVNFWKSLCKLAEEFDRSQINEFYSKQSGAPPYQITPCLSKFLTSKMPTMRWGAAFWDQKSNFNAAAAAELLQRPELKPAMEKFVDFLKKHYNYNEVLVDMASRMLLLQKAPSVLESEERLFSALKSKDKTLDECYNDLGIILSAYTEDKKS